MPATNRSEPPGAEAVATTHAQRGQLGLTASGRVDAPAIVFLHGTRLSRAVWTSQLEALGDEFRVVALDLPGHGDRSAERFNLDAAVGVAAAAIQDGAAGGRAVVVGLSLGGYVAMALAADHPELVRGLVIVGASAEPVGVHAIPYRALAGAIARFMTSRPERLNTWFFRWRYPPRIADPIIAGGFWPTGGAAALRSLVGQRFLPRLAAYPGPTLVLNGEFDLLFRLSAGAFAAAAKDARRVVLGGALHLSNLDRPAAFSLAVREFARSVATT